MPICPLTLWVRGLFYTIVVLVKRKGGDLRITYKKPEASGRRSGWAKVIVGVLDGVGARGFDGDYLTHGNQVDIPDGSLVLEVRPLGSVKNGYEQAYIYRATPEGFQEIFSCDWRKKFLDLKDFVVKQLQQDRNEPDGAMKAAMAICHDLHEGHIDPNYKMSLEVMAAAREHIAQLIRTYYE